MMLGLPTDFSHACAAAGPQDILDCVCKEVGRAELVWRQNVLTKGLQ
jgi:hypothetical protein